MTQEFRAHFIKNFVLFMMLFLGALIVTCDYDIYRGITPLDVISLKSLLSQMSYPTVFYTLIVQNIFAVSILIIGSLISYYKKMGAIAAVIIEGALIGKTLSPPTDPGLFFLSLFPHSIFEFTAFIGAITVIVLIIDEAEIQKINPVKYFFSNKGIRYTPLLAGFVILMVFAAAVESSVTIVALKMYLGMW